MPDTTTEQRQLQKIKTDNYNKIKELRAQSLEAETKLQELRAAQYAEESTPEYVAQKNAEYAAEQDAAAVEEAARIVSPPADASGRAPVQGQ